MCPCTRTTYDICARILVYICPHTQVVVENTKKNLCVRAFFDGKKSLNLSSYSGGGGEVETKARTQEHQYEYALILVYICPHTQVEKTTKKLWRAKEREKKKEKSTDARRRASEYEDRYRV